MMLWKSLLAATLLSSVTLHAHQDPSDVIDTLTHKIEKETDKKKLSDLYLKRAIEYRALPSSYKGNSLVRKEGRRENKRAYADISTSLNLNPENFEARLLQAKLTLGPLGEESFIRALKVAKTENQQSRAHQALAERLYHLKKFGQAIIHCDKAIANDKQKKLDLILFKSHLLWRINEPFKRVIFLAESQQKNGSVVLQNALIDAMIDAGKQAEVKELVHKEMADSRFKSSWLIRAALCEKKTSKSKNIYANAAVTEIKKRLNLDRPDVTLLMDLARAYSILGDYEKARFYANKASQKSHDQWAMAELEAKLKIVNE